MSQPYIGEIRLLPYTFAPLGWMYCDGSLLPISQNATLYSLLGTTYGGDGNTTFAVPDLRGRVPIGSGTPTGHSGAAHPLGSAGGAQSVVLTEAELPPHRHPLAVSNRAGTSTVPTGYPAGGGHYSTSADASLATPSVGDAGGGAALANEMPYLALAWCISLLGVYPSAT